MPYRRISKDLKESSLRLWELGWEVEDIAFAFGVSCSSLYRWQANFDNYNDVTRPPSPLRGPTRILTRALLTACEDLFAQEADLYLDEVVTWLALVHGLNISTSTLSRNLIEAGLTRKILQRLASERNDELRREWTAMVATEFTPDGSQFVFVDETSKNELTWACHYGRAPAGHRATITDVFIRGQRYSLVAAITIDGYVAADVVEGSYDTDLFYSFIARKVLPNMLPFPAERSVIILDNCRIHHNQDLIDLVNAAGCLIIFLPPYSPDLNPIEESFSSLKAYLRRHSQHLRHDQDPVGVLLEACGHITPEMAKGWFRHAGYIRD